MRKLKQIRKDQAAGRGMFSTKEEVDRARRQDFHLRFSREVLKKLKEDVSSRKDINKYGCEALIQEYIEKLKWK